MASEIPRAFSPAQQAVLEDMSNLIGRLLAGCLYAQIRLAAVEAVLVERGMATKDEIEGADRRAADAWRTGLMVDSLLDPDLAALLDDIRRRVRGNEDQ